MILSVSRRTDIPAFYSEWLLRRLGEGRAAYRHPFTGKRVEVLLSPEIFKAVVFWTKDARPLFGRLSELEDLGYCRYVFHYTITGLGRGLEPAAPDEEEALDSLVELSERIGPGRVFWRFDPIVLTERTGPQETLSRFERLSSRLAGRVARCFTSLMIPYKKVRPRLAAYEAASGDRVQEPAPPAIQTIAAGMLETARARKIDLCACCAPELSRLGVPPASCIDGDYLRSLWPEARVSARPAPTRQYCRCHRAVDIGAYDTCAHMCRYCYANAHDRVILKNLAAHDPDSLTLG